MNKVTKHNLQTREQKIAFLKAVEQGKATVMSQLQLITATLFEDGDEVYAVVTKDGVTVIEQSKEAISKLPAGSITHNVRFEDYS